MSDRPAERASTRARRALTSAQRLALLREALAVAAQAGFARAEVEVSERGDVRMMIEKGRAAPAELKV